MVLLAITLDANAFITLEDPDAYDPFLNEVLRRGLDGFYTVAVTSELKAEVARDPVLLRRQRSLQKLEKFPEQAMPSDTAIQQLAAELLGWLFPQANPTTPAHTNRMSDCRQLAIHLLGKRDYFITADGDLLHRLTRLPTHLTVQAGTAETFLHQVFYPRIQPEREPLVLPHLSLRRATIEDRAAITQLLDPIKSNYDDFAGWLNSLFQKSNIEIKLAIANRTHVAGIAISQPKSAGVWKLSTFYIDPTYRRIGLGQHLLFHEVQSWLAQGLRKVIVTTDRDNLDLIQFFQRVGFVIEGLSPERYPGRTELVLGRHFVDRTFTPETALDLARVLAERVLAAPHCEETPDGLQCQSVLPGLPWHWTPAPSTLDLHTQGGPGQAFSLDVTMAGQPVHTWNLWDLETGFHPLTITWPERKAVIIPIYEEYAEQLFEMHQPQPWLIPPDATRRLLQMDNTYYCWPRYADVLVRGTPLLFYVTGGSNRGSGVAGHLVGMAFLEEAEVGPPDVLYIRHGQRGVYDQAQITRHVNPQGQAMALHFSWLRPFPHLVPSKTITTEVPHWNPQTLYAMPHAAFLALCKAGGIRLGSG